MRTYRFKSAPMKIGKHFWRFVVYDAEYCKDRKYFTDFEWRTKYDTEEYEWRPMDEWPRYDADDGANAGCPKTLRTLYDMNKEQIRPYFPNA